MSNVTITNSVVGWININKYDLIDMTKTIEIKKLNAEKLQYQTSMSPLFIFIQHTM